MRDSHKAPDDDQIMYGCVREYRGASSTSDTFRGWFQIKMTDFDILRS